MINHENKDTYSKAATFANEFGKPIILDPSGANLTPYRAGITHQLLLTHKTDIVRGNASEVFVINGEFPSKGGKEDVIIVKDQHRIFDYGHLLMPRAKKPTVQGAGTFITAFLDVLHSLREQDIEKYCRHN